ncbi:MAG TPA: family 43 glycosylhydrolase [Polyangiaceae bacterium]|nr:family 43 glycosylhydrolase [Polyangiaceae bacterium]
MPFDNLRLPTPFQSAFRCGPYSSLLAFCTVVGCGSDPSGSDTSVSTASGPVTASAGATTASTGNTSSAASLTGSSSVTAQSASVSSTTSGTTTSGTTTTGGLGATVTGSTSGTTGSGGAGSVTSSSVSSTGGSTTGGTWEGPWPPAETFSNPVLWQDIADPDVIRVGDVFYYTGSNMHLSPGAPILRSYDLVNWEFAGHAIPKLDFGDKYDLVGNQRAYIDGDWASTLRFRESDQKFYFLACIDFSQTYVWTADQVEGPWERQGQINHCYYDAGMLIDDDDTIYVAYGHGDIGVARLTPDGFGEEQSDDQVFNAGFTLEGSRMYKRNGYYYIWLTRPADGQFVLRSTDPFGPYEIATVVDRMAAPVQGAGTPHQGALVETQNGDWYYMAFVDAYPGARMPVLAPVTWQDDWPVVTTVDGGWGAEYPFPNVPRPPRLMAPHTGTDEFNEPTLNHAWEWNHNSDDTKWSTGDGLTLQTASVTDDLYQARNTLVRRIVGPASTATIELDYSGMQDGDVAGLGITRHTSGFIGIKKSGDSTRLVMVNDITLNVPEWTTNSKGTEVASEDISGGTIWLRVSADIRPGAGRQATFAYSIDGTNFQPLGEAHTMDSDWQFFIAYRFMILNYATTALGGSIKVNSFNLELND